MTRPRSMSTEVRRLLPAPGVEGRADEVDGRGAIAAVFTVFHVRDRFVMELFRRRELIGRNSAYTLRGLASLPGEGKEKAPQRVSLRSFVFNHRDGGIRTRDPLNPIQVRYRAALRPVNKYVSLFLSPSKLPGARSRPSAARDRRTNQEGSTRPDRAIAREVNPIQSLSRASRGMRYRAARSLSRAQRGIP